MAVDGEHEVYGICPERAETGIDVLAEVSKCRPILQPILDGEVHRRHECSALREEGADLGPDPGGPVSGVELGRRERRNAIDRLEIADEPSAAGHIRQ